MTIKYPPATRYTSSDITQSLQFKVCFHWCHTLKRRLSRLWKMNSTSSLLNASLVDTLMPSMDDDDGGSQPLCYYPLYYISLVALAIAMLMLTVTLILIPCHRRLRKQHHIFPFNLVLSDFSGAIAAVFLGGFVNYKLPREVRRYLFFLRRGLIISV